MAGDKRETAEQFILQVVLSGLEKAHDRPGYRAMDSYRVLAKLSCCKNSPSVVKHSLSQLLNLLSRWAVNITSCMSVCSCVCLNFCPSACLIYLLSVGLSVCLSACMSVCLSVCLTVCVLLRLSASLPVWFSFSSYCLFALCQFLYNNHNVILHCIFFSIYISASSLFSLWLCRLTCNGASDFLPLKCNPRPVGVGEGCLCILCTPGLCKLSFPGS